MKCQNCGQPFQATQDDLAFYKKIGVPPPTFCPSCRLQRRLAWRNERTLYRRPCTLCGETTASRHPAETPFPVYCPACYASDRWDPLDFGVEYDFSAPFFSQWAAFRDTVPHPALFIINAANSSFCNQSLDIKNVVLGTGALFTEDAYHVYGVDYSRDVVDITYGQHLEQCGYSTDISNCNGVTWSHWAKQCINSAFLYDCRNCQDCIGCVNMRNARYCILNRQYTREEYEKEKRRLNLDSYSGLIKFEGEFRKLSESFPRRATMLDRCVDSTGDNLQDVNSSRECFDCYKMEHCKYIVRGVDGLRDCYDLSYSGIGAELCYEALSCMGSMNKFSYGPYGQEMQYCLYTTNRGGGNLFGCVSMTKKTEYCILNRQYTKEEYGPLVSKIIEHMNDMPYTDMKGRIYRYGEFFPAELSQFGYNETIANEYFPKTRAEALEEGLRWKERAETTHATTMDWSEIPDTIAETPDAITSAVIACAHQRQCDESCLGAFRIFPAELAFCRRMGLPLPRICTNCRHYARLRSRNPFHLWDRSCDCAGKTSRVGSYRNTASHEHGEAPCGTMFQTNHAPGLVVTVYCEQCYTAEVS